MDNGKIGLTEMGAGIGPNLDYSVFLIRMTGRGIWRVGGGKNGAQKELDTTMNVMIAWVLRT